MRCVRATFSKMVRQEKIVQLRFLGKESNPDNSPTLYATDQGSYVVQGWIVTDPDILASLDIGDGETVVEVPARLMRFLSDDGLAGSVGLVQPPIVSVKENGNYVVQGKRVTDTSTLGQMHIPADESCVEVTKVSVQALLVGA